MKMARLGILIVASVLIIGCSGVRNREAVCTGFLKVGLSSDAFKQVWGLPTRTKVVSGDEIVSAGWGGHGGSFYKGKTHFEVWAYEDRQVELAFDRGRLAGWKTDKTLKELDSSSSKVCQENGKVIVQGNQ
jgi:hypothetical protein